MISTRSQITREKSEYDRLIMIWSQYRFAVLFTDLENK